MIQQALKNILSQTALALWPEIKLPEFSVDLPKNPDHGDYASNIALLLTKLVKKKPRDIAQEICDNFKDPDKIIVLSEIAGPGFINLKISNKFLESVIPKILESAENYGLAEKNNKKVLLEFVSANPTGPLHLGHARPAFLGDGVARVLKAAGYEVTKEFYINDAGNQVETLGRSIYARYRELFGEKIKLEKDAYPGEYVINIAKELKKQDGDKWLDNKKYLERCVQFGIEENLKSIKSALNKADIKFDSWYSEASLHKRGLIQKLIKKYENRDMIYIADQARDTENKVRREESNAAKYAHKQVGGTFIKTADFGDEEDRIILRKDGRPVYLVGDIAYHEEKFERGFDRIIDVFGADHAGHVPRMRACLKALGVDEHKLEFLLAQMVKLIKGGQELKFSKRTGQIIELKEFVEEVSPDVARVIFLMRAPNTQFDFDLDLIKKSTSDNPVFYLQYGHARMATVLNKSGVDLSSLRLSAEALAKAEGAMESRLKLPEERNMLKKLAAYPDIILSAANHLEPHRVLFFCHDLIKEFHSYFTKYRSTEKIISDDKDLTQSRLLLVAAMKQTLYNALTLLGISAPEHMTHE